MIGSSQNKKDVEFLKKQVEKFFSDKSLNHFSDFFSRKNPYYRPIFEPIIISEEFEKFSGNFCAGELIGEIPFDEEGTLFLFAGVKTNSQLSSRTSKKRQFDLAKRILKGNGYDAGIFIFYDEQGNFRMSLVYQIPEGRKRKFSTYKRFTYFVENNELYHTFLKQVGECSFRSFEDIKKAFSVDPVTKEFYREIANWYFWALNHPALKFPPGVEKIEHGKEIALIRLITRLMFIWFLKKKDLVPDKLFDEEKLRKILKDFEPEGEDSTYYRAILQNLFFATLSCKQEERRFAEKGRYYGPGRGGSKDFGNQYAYRFKELFNIDEQEILELFKDIPFLNGGLFEVLDNKDNDFYVDGFTRRKQFQAHIPNFLFFGKEREVDLSNEYGLSNFRKEKVRGIINIFKSYNFTIDENSPVDVEIALDPEMLGKVFENLLAAYNPETSTTARKATGSYYTPREIVDFMVEESLKEHIKTRIPGIDEEKLDMLFSFSDEYENCRFDAETEDRIISIIDNLKILDPAVGSGAFPMGVLHKLVFLLQRLDPHNKKWLQKQAEKINDISDPILREETLQRLKERFENKEIDYGRKLYIIQNCLYGVDIQPIAIQICKLRFFISLLVDERVNENKQNWGIEPLPNLETNFVCANTLIKLTKSGEEELFEKSPEVQGIIKELEKLREKYFTTSSPKEKANIRKEDRKQRKKLEVAAKGASEKYLQKIINWEPYDTAQSADWFDPFWMFGVKKFDIVIGNPPYIRQERITGQKKILHDQNYETFTSTSDIYVFFFERGYEVLKRNGILCFIVSNKWMRAKYGEKLRKFLKEKTQIIKLIDFNGHRVFAQTVDTCIVLFKKKPEEDNTITFAVINSDVKNPITYAQENWKTLSQSSLSDSVWTLADEKILKLKEKIEKIGKPLKEWNVRINRGVLTGYNKAFIIDNETKERLCREDPKSIEILKPILRGRDIGRYYYRWAGLWLIKIESGWTNKNRGKKDPEKFFKETYPAIYNHLILFGNKKGKGKGLFKRDDQGDYWWELRDCSYYEDFEKEKIVYPEFASEACFTFVPKEMYVLDTAWLLVTQDSKSLTYLLALINSKVLWLYLTFLVANLSENAFRMKKVYLEYLPLPPITPQNQPIAQKIEQLVDKILYLAQSEDYLENKEKQAQVKKYERAIDQLVYKLYSLTEEEIILIENSY